MKKKGFTLIELMIVVAIIGILAAVAIPNMVYTKKKAKLSACISNLKAIGSALDMYASDNGDHFPDQSGTGGTTPAANASILMTLGYTKSAIICPVGAGTAVNYLYAGLWTTDVYTVSCPDATLHFYNPKQTLTSLYFQAEAGIKRYGFGDVLLD